MKKFKKVLVGLDLSEMDDVIISQAKNLVQVLGVEMVYFVHVAEDLTLSEEIIKDYPDLLAPADETIEKEILETLNQASFPDSIKFEVEAKEGNPLETILRWSKVKNADLIILGRKHDMEGSGSLAKRIAHKSPCSVLFLTENPLPIKFERIMVPIDFSSHSVLALECAQEIAIDHHSIKCFHLYEVPAGYSKTGKSFKEFSEIMLQNSKNDYEKFRKKNNLPNFDCEFILKKEDNKEKYFLEEANKYNSDFIIIGSRGRTDSANLLIGSVAEKLIHQNNKIPMLVLKKKGENMHFLEALFRV
jgi:nucleotide-binding universal stress UspA family protein